MHKTRENIGSFFELPQATWRAEDWGDMHVSFETYHEQFDGRFWEGCPEITAAVRTGAM